MACRMASRKMSSSKGLAKNAVAPFCMAMLRTDSSSSAVTTMTRVPGEMARSSFMSSRPLMRGIQISISATLTGLFVAYLRKPRGSRKNRADNQQIRASAPAPLTSKGHRRQRRWWRRRHPKQQSSSRSFFCGATSARASKRHDQHSRCSR